jgi:hypothetical protein
VPRPWVAVFSESDCTPPSRLPGVPLPLESRRQGTLELALDSLLFNPLLRSLHLLNCPGPEVPGVAIYAHDFIAFSAA